MTPLMTKLNDLGEIDPHIGMTRRSFLRRTSSLACLSLSAPAFLHGAAVSNSHLNRSVYSAGKDSSGNYGLIHADQNGIRMIAALPERAHEILIHPSKPHALVVARRPGNWCMIIDTDSKQIVHKITTASNSHFYGHAVFDRTGRYLITTENDLLTGQGKIVMRDSVNHYAIHKSIPSYGVGPHQLKVMPDSNQLVIANGGISTRPDTGRKKLNLDTMRPNLSYIDLDTGSLVEQVTLPVALHQLSIRHLAVNAQGDVAIAMQYQGNTGDNMPLVASHRPRHLAQEKPAEQSSYQNNPLKILDIPLTQLSKMRGYCGSVCFDKSGHYLAVSAPRGDLIIFFDFINKRYVNSRQIPDGCGLASAGVASFEISNGRGSLYHHRISSPTSAEALLQRDARQINPQQAQAQRNNTLSFDNHLSTNG